MSIVPQTDPRIDELLQLAQEDGRPLALAAETICALEDAGWLADPFTAQLWPDPARQQTALPGMVIMLVSADLKAQAMPA